MSYPSDVESRLLIAGGLDELARVAADVVLDAARAAVAARGVFRIVLSGGETPRRLYETLAVETRYAALPWERTHVFWGDERYVAPDDVESNYRMAHDALLSRVPIPAGNVHPMRTDAPDPERAARDYEAVIRDACALGPGEWPRFDLVLLGIGEDGHTASLFPGSPVLHEPHRLVAAVRTEAKPPPVRLTLTLPVFAHAAAVAFLAAGAAKAAAVAAAIQPPPDGMPPPAGLVRPIDGELIWILDLAAARFVRPPSPDRPAARAARPAGSGTGS